MASVDETSLPPINWAGASKYARILVGGGPVIPLDHARRAVVDVEQRAHRALALVSDHSGLEFTGEAHIRVVDRAKWSDTNIAGLKELTNRLDIAVAEDDSVTGRVTGFQAGALLAFLSSRVLGQYEPFSRENGQLMFVIPNIVNLERRLQVNPGDFRLWIALHEGAHLLQFQAVPWMKDHFLHLVRQVIESTDTGGFLKEAIDRLKDEQPQDELGLLGAIAGDQREHLERVQALMSLLEGHAESLMDTIGADEIVSVETLRKRFNRYRSNPGSLGRVMRRLLGLEAKYSQYVAGKKFVDTVVSADGISGFNRVWDHPENLPSLAEIRDPELWRSRVRA